MPNRMSRKLSYFAAFVGAWCLYFIIDLFFSTHVRRVRNGLIQGSSSASDWRLPWPRRMRGSRPSGETAGSPRLGSANPAMACSYGPRTPSFCRSGQCAGRGDVLVIEHGRRGADALRPARLRHAFAVGQTSPDDAFCSLTMGTAPNRFVPNPIRRYSRPAAERRRFNTVNGGVVECSLVRPESVSQADRRSVDRRRCTRGCGLSRHCYARDSNCAFAGVEA